MPTASRSARWIAVALALTLAGQAGVALAAIDRPIVVTDRPFNRFGRSVTATFYVAASPHQAFAVLTDHAHMADFMPLVEDVKVLAAGPRTARVRFHLRYLRLFDIVEIDERRLDPGRSITWHATDGPLRCRMARGPSSPRGRARP
jgi:hypothetical protein